MPDLPPRTRGGGPRRCGQPRPVPRRRRHAHARARRGTGGGQESRSRTYDGSTQPHEVFNVSGGKAERSGLPALKSENHRGHERVLG